MVRTTVDRPAEHQEPKAPPGLREQHHHHTQDRSQPAAAEPASRGPPPRTQRNPEGTSRTQRNPEEDLEPEGTSQHREEHQVPQDCEATWQNPHHPEPQVQNQPVWKQVVCSRGDADCWPSHLRVFSCEEEYRLVRHTHLLLQRSGFYWGAMSMETSHHVLSACEPGAFLIRDSGQPDVFFTLSYRGDDGPTSVRILLANQLFSLHGSSKTFDSLLGGLLAFYTSAAASGKLRRPYRHDRPDSLQAICRRAVHRSFGPHGSTSLPGLSNTVRDYLEDYPYDI